MISAWGTGVLGWGCRCSQGGACVITAYSLCWETHKQQEVKEGRDDGRAG